MPDLILASQSHSFMLGWEKCVTCAKSWHGNAKLELSLTTPSVHAGVGEMRDLCGALVW